jgi:hypothetical protein
MNWELVSTLPPGSGSRTILARLGARFGVLRQLEAEPLYPPAPPEPVLPLLEVAVVAGLRYAVYSVAMAASLREVTEALLKEEQLAPVGLVARVVLDAARALAKIAPARPHGGLGDGALLIGFDGVTRVLDYGAPRTGRFQPRGPPSFPNDVFALGAVLHSALTGFTGHYGEAMAEGLQLPPPSLSNPEAPSGLDALVLRATARDEADRQADASQLADELEAAMAGALFSAQDVAAVAGGLLAHHRTRLERLFAEAPIDRVQGPPSPAAARVEPDGPATLVPWATGPIEVSRPPRLEDASEPTPPALELLGLEPEEPEEPEEPTQPGVQAPQVMPLEPVRPPAEPTKPARASVPPPRAPSPSRSAAPRPGAGDDSSDERTVVHFLLKSEPPPPPQAPVPVRPQNATLPGRGPAWVAGADDGATRPQLPPVPTRPGKARNTTVHERARAKGQERLDTPPLGLPPASAPEDAAPSEASLPAMPSVELDEADAGGSRGTVARVVLAVVLAALAILAVGVHELAPELIERLRARVGASSRPPAEAVPEEAQPPPTDEAPSGPALERAPRPEESRPAKRPR